MTSNIRLGSVSLDCADASALADFWSTLLGGEIVFRTDEFVALNLGTIWLTTVTVENYVSPTWPSGESPKQMHLDLAVKDLAAASKEALALGATLCDVQPNPDSYLVLVDPAGHPFCLTTLIPD